MSSRDYLYSRVRPQFKEGLEALEPSDSNSAVLHAVVPRYTLNDVVLGAPIRQQLDEALAKIKYFQKIYLEWGFGTVDPAGKGVVLNFFGPPAPKPEPDWRLFPSPGIVQLFSMTRTLMPCALAVSKSSSDPLATVMTPVLASIAKRPPALSTSE